MKSLCLEVPYSEARVSMVLKFSFWFQFDPIIQNCSDIKKVNKVWLLYHILMLFTFYLQLTLNGLQVISEVRSQ